MANKTESKAKKDQVAKKGKKESSKKKSNKNVQEGKIFIDASFNNTIVTVTDVEGNTLASSSAGTVGFRGAKKSTAFAATKAAQDAVIKAQKYGIKEAKIYIKGPGAGRNAAVKGIDSVGLRITSLSDVTTLPFNGCRPRRRPRN
jgi:small subunit ribosomal protein S11